jgi:hypothetical protein
MPYNIWCGGCGNHIGMGKTVLLFLVFILCIPLSVLRGFTTHSRRACTVCCMYAQVTVHAHVIYSTRVLETIRKDCFMRDFMLVFGCWIFGKMSVLKLLFRSLSFKEALSTTMHLFTLLP